MRQFARPDFTFSRCFPWPPASLYLKAGTTPAAKPKSNMTTKDLVARIKAVLLKLENTGKRFLSHADDCKDVESARAELTALHSDLKVIEGREAPPVPPAPPASGFITGGLLAAISLAPLAFFRGARDGGLLGLVLVVLVAVVVVAICHSTKGEPKP